MCKTVAFGLIVLSAAVSFAQASRPQNVPQSINSMWADEQKDFVSLAEAVPQTKWNYKPQGAGFRDVRTFAEQVKHVACANEAFAKEMRGATPPAACDKGGPNPAKTKAELMKYLRDSFTILNEQIDQTTEKNMMQPVDGPYGGPNSRLGMAFLAVWHVADHYGQLVEYARANGVVPPASRPQPAK